jgi:type VI secretion system protein ImpI
MSLVLTIEHGPRAQAVRQARLDDGELVIGRSTEADWQIEDPDQFVSRTHCRITAERGGYVVTDTSSSGLFIDDAGSPLGRGNSARLSSGMRLRLGDYVLGVDLQGADRSGNRADAAAPPGAGSPAGFDDDGFFSVRTEEEPARPRPAELPDPFERPAAGAFRSTEEPLRSPAFDDPFSLDPVSTPEPGNPPANGRRQGDEVFSFDPHPGDKPAEPPERTTTEWAGGGGDFDFGRPEAPKPGRESPPAAQDARARPEDAWDPPPAREHAMPLPAAAASARMPRAAALYPDSALREAFLRGLGLDKADLPDRDLLAEMERFGRQYRMMMEGLMQLLRKRAEEKGNARVAQTVVGASAVNPLKFLPTVDDALATITAGRSAGFLQGDEAIADTVRDLAEHHVRAWRGVQGALRRMVDRFDPVAFEEELKSTSALDKVLAGGRGAKLWELYKKRHGEIAASAEERFLGEIGADFRNAYEEE